MIRTTKVIWGTLAGSLEFVIATGLQIVLIPIILRTGGQEVLGLYAIILQIAGYLALLDLGVLTALGRSLSQAADDPARFRDQMSSAVYFLLLMGGVYALIGALAAISLEGLFQSAGPLAGEARMAMLWLAAWGLLRLPLAIYPTALMAVQDLSFQPLVGAMANILRMTGAVIALQAGFGIRGLIAATILGESLSYGIQFMRFQRLRAGWSIQPHRFNMSTLRELLRFGLQALRGNLAGRIILFTDNVIAGTISGAAAASVYFNTQTPINAPSSVVLRLANNAAPGINELWAKRELDKLRDIFLRLQRLTLLSVTPIVIAGWFYLESVVGIWVGSRQFGGNLMTMWLILFAAMFASSQVPRVFIYASGNIERFSQLISVEAIVKLGLSFLLGRWLGLHGIALATTIAHIPTAIYLQTRAHRDLEIQAKDWLRHIGWPVLRSATPMVIAAGVLVKVTPPDSWGTLALHGVVLGMIHSISAYLLGLTASDRVALVKLVRGSLFAVRT